MTQPLFSVRRLATTMAVCAAVAAAEGQGVGLFRRLQGGDRSLEILDPEGLLKEREADPSQKILRSRSECPAADEHHALLEPRELLGDILVEIHPVGVGHHQIAEDDVVGHAFGAQEFHRRAMRASTSRSTSLPFFRAVSRRAAVASLSRSRSAPLAAS